MVVTPRLSLAITSIVLPGAPASAGPNVTRVAGDRPDPPVMPVAQRVGPQM